MPPHRIDRHRVPRDLPPHHAAPAKPEPRDGELERAIRAEELAFGKVRAEDRLA